MSEYTQGVADDGAAILKDGQPITIEEILEALRERDDLAAKLESCKREIAALSSSLNEEDVSHSNTIDQRDYAEKMADKLSFAIIGITGRDIGEHSSANCPWSNALEHAEEYESERDEGIEREQALKAHLERLSDTWSSVVDAGTFYSPRNLENVMCAVFSDTPTTSLDRRDALKHKQKHFQHSSE